MAKYGEEMKFAKSVGVYLAGGAVGVLVEKAVNDAIAAGQLPNPNWMTVTLSDVGMVTAELAAAFYLRKKKPNKRKKLASNFLVGMSTGTVAAQAYEWGAQQGSWFALQRAGRASLGMARPMANTSGGRYGRTAPLPNGRIGGQMRVGTSTFYPRR